MAACGLSVSVSFWPRYTHRFSGAHMDASAVCACMCVRACVYVRITSIRPFVQLYIHFVSLCFEAEQPNSEYTRAMWWWALSTVYDAATSDTMKCCRIFIFCSFAVSVWWIDWNGRKPEMAFVSLRHAVFVKLLLISSYIFFFSLYLSRPAPNICSPISIQSNSDEVNVSWSPFQWKQKKNTSTKAMRRRIIYRSQPTRTNVVACDGT